MMVSKVPKNRIRICASCLQRCPQRSFRTIPSGAASCPTIKIIESMAHRCDFCSALCFGHPTSEPHPSPDIARFLSTNDPPSPSQEKEFRQTRLDGAKHLADLDETIKEMRETLEGLMIERDALAWKVQNCHLVLNPVRRLPDDILREIFLSACARSTINPAYFYIVAPTIITSVCRSWNSIATTFPRLWRQCSLSLACPSTISRKGSSTGSREYSGYLARVSGVSLAIARSGTCPPWVDLCLEDTFSYSSPAFPLLLSLANRIQRLRVRTSDLSRLDCPEFRHFVGNLTILESLDLSSTTNHIMFDAISLPHALKHLAITPYKTFSKSMIDLGWSHLESLELRARYLGLRHTSVQSTLHILFRARNIRLLTFTEDWDNEALPQYAAILDNDIELRPTPQCLTIPCLTDLIVESTYDVLANIRTPSLERLVMTGRSPLMITRAEKMLERSGCALRRLTMQELADGHPDIDHIGVGGSLIRQCVSLQELSLLRIEAGVESVTQLLSSLQSLPSLRTLVLDISYIRNFCPETQNAFIDELLTFLESRRRLNESPDDAVPSAASYTELESFTLHALAFDFTESQHKRIDALRASGLFFYICRYVNSDPRMY